MWQCRKGLGVDVFQWQYLFNTFLHSKVDIRPTEMTQKSVVYKTKTFKYKAMLK